MANKNRATMKNANIQWTNIQNFNKYNVSLKWIFRVKLILIRQLLKVKKLILIKRLRRLPKNKQKMTNR